MIPVSVRAALEVYGVLWRAAIPFLSKAPRIRDGFGQRTLSESLPAPADVWMQAASGGEAYLAWEILRNLSAAMKGRRVRVLVTTNTRQGLEILERAKTDVHSKGGGVIVQCRYFPFDAPGIMESAFAAVRPKTAVILETELWPGFLRECKRWGVHVIQANGRMNPRSMGGYLAWPGLFRSIAPDKILAISEKDARRFATVFACETGVMPNIKFDRMANAGCMKKEDNPLARLIGESEFAVFGSVRKEEEVPALEVLAGLHRARPKCVIGLFPRHMERVEAWKERLELEGLPWQLRSQTTQPPAPGTIILWDAFGELVPAYGLAKAAFVGGSLAPLGGQNFLEPLTCGVVPVIGPYWKNFFWVGESIFEAGLARYCVDANAVLEAMLDILSSATPRADVIKAARGYIRDRLGGAKTVCKHIADSLI